MSYYFYNTNLLSPFFNFDPGNVLTESASSSTFWIIEFGLELRDFIVCLKEENNDKLCDIVICDDRVMFSELFLFYFATTTIN